MVLQYWSLVRGNYIRRMWKTFKCHDIIKFMTFDRRFTHHIWRQCKKGLLLGKQIDSIRISLSVWKLFVFGNEGYINLSFHWKTDTYILVANVMESLLLNGICLNLIGNDYFWSYVELWKEILLISSIHYITKLNGQTQSVLSGDHWDSREVKKVNSGVVTWSEVCLGITTLMQLCSVGFR